MKIVSPAIKLTKDDLKQYKLLEFGTILRVRFVEDREVAGELALPVYVVNGEIEKLKLTGKRLDPGEVMEMQVVTDLPPTSFQAIPVYVVGEESPTEWVEYGGSLEVQSGQSEEATPI